MKILIPTPPIMNSPSILRLNITTVLMSTNKGNIRNRRWKTIKLKIIKRSMKISKDCCTNSIYNSKNGTNKTTKKTRKAYYRTLKNKPIRMYTHKHRIVMPLIITILIRTVIKIWMTMRKIIIEKKNSMKRRMSTKIPSVVKILEMRPWWPNYSMNKIN